MKKMTLEAAVNVNTNTNLIVGVGIKQTSEEVTEKDISFYRIVDISNIENTESGDYLDYDDVTADDIVDMMARGEKVDGVFLTEAGDHCKVCSVYGCMIDEFPLIVGDEDEEYIDNDIERPVGFFICKDEDDEVYTIINSDGKVEHMDKENFLEIADQDLLVNVQIYDDDYSVHCIGSYTPDDDDNESARLAAAYQRGFRDGFQCGYSRAAKEQLEQDYFEDEYSEDEEEQEDFSSDNGYSVGKLSEDGGVLDDFYDPDDFEYDDKDLYY